MAKDNELSRRERQIMDVIYARGQATAKDVVDGLPDPPSRTAVRTLLRILEGKGHLKHKVVDREYVYSPTRSRARAGKSALHRVIETFFGGSVESALAAHLSDPATQLSDRELERLAALIREAREKGN